MEDHSAHFDRFSRIPPGTAFRGHVCEEFKTPTGRASSAPRRCFLRDRCDAIRPSLILRVPNNSASAKRSSPSSAALSSLYPLPCGRCPIVRRLVRHSSALSPSASLSLPFRLFPWPVPCLVNCMIVPPQCRSTHPSGGEE